MFPEDDTLKSLSLITRREVEARVIAPLIEAFSQEFGKEQTLKILDKTIKQIAKEQGTQLAKNKGGNTISIFAETINNWEKDDALQIENVEQTDTRLCFNVIKCRYAELYQKLGIPELGVLLSCNRDVASIEGFNPHIKLYRTQTIMEGGDLCDFCYRMEENLSIK